MVSAPYSVTMTGFPWRSCQCRRSLVAWRVISSVWPVSEYQPKYRLIPIRSTWAVDWSWSQGWFTTTMVGRVGSRDLVRLATDSK